MSQKIFFSIALFLGSILLSAQKQNIEDILQNLPNVTFEKMTNSGTIGTTYKLRVKQPIDHSDPQKGFFYQKVYLTHNNFDRPTVIHTQGYQVNANRTHEITSLLNANEINVEHRFFGESKPDFLDYSYLNLKQVAADLHHIRTLFHTVYSNKWVSTGISKGGSTTIFYKYFYPKDVDASVSYVAPLTNTYEDKRIYEFLDTVGTKACREKIRNFQVRLLKNRKKVIPLLQTYSKRVGWKYSYLSIEKAFEFAVLEYPFTFWQWGHECAQIPKEELSLEEAVDYFLKIDPLSLFTDGLIEKYGSHYYQAASEMGYYGYNIEDFKDWLVALATDRNPHATFLPNKMKVNFDGQLLKKVHTWIQSQGNNLIFIYGTKDTWTACAVPEKNDLDAEWFFMKGKHHGNARIRHMNRSNYKKVCLTLERWLDVSIPNNKGK